MNGDPWLTSALPSPNRNVYVTMTSLKSGSNEPDPSNCTFKGVVPDVGFAFRTATGGLLTATEITTWATFVLV
jgi:hypothetical protein